MCKEEQFSCPLVVAPDAAAHAGAGGAAAQSTDRDMLAQGRPEASLEDVGMLSKPFEELDRRCAEAADTGDTPGLAYAVFRDGHLVCANTFGVADIETKQPWRFDTICRMYSMTKTVAVCGLMVLVEKGRVSLDDPVAKYLPAFDQEQLQVAREEAVMTRGPENPLPKTQLTIRHLLTHTSGLSYGPALNDESSCPTEQSYMDLMGRVDRKEVSSLADWCDEVTKLPLRFEPCDRWEYSYGVDVAGRIMEIVSGKRLDNFIHDAITGPLGMCDTLFQVPDEKKCRLAAFYRRDDDTNKLNLVDGSKQSLWLESCEERVISAGGTVGTVLGGLVSTMVDFSRLCLMLQNWGEFDGVRILKPETVRMMSTSLLPAITGKDESWCLETAGLGFGLLGSVAVQHPDANWYDVPGEIGWGGLAGTAWAIDHRERTVVLTFTQLMYELWIDEEARKAVRESLGMVPPVEPAGDSVEAASVDVGTASAAPEEVVGAPATSTPPSLASVSEEVSPDAPRNCSLFSPENPETKAITPTSKRVVDGPSGDSVEPDDDQTPPGKKARISEKTCGLTTLPSSEKLSFTDVHVLAGNALHDVVDKDVKTAACRPVATPISRATPTPARSGV